MPISCKRSIDIYVEHLYGEIHYKYGEEEEEIKNVLGTQNIFISGGGGGGEGEIDSVCPKKELDNEVIGSEMEIDAEMFRSYDTSVANIQFDTGRLFVWNNEMKFNVLFSLIYLQCIIKKGIKILLLNTE